MLTFLFLIAACAGIAWVINEQTKQVPASVLTLTNKVEKTTTVKNVLDVNSDNKVNFDGAKAAVKKVKKTAKQVTTKAKNPRFKKPKH